MRAYTVWVGKKQIGFNIWGKGCNKGSRFGYCFKTLSLSPTVSLGFKGVLKKAVKALLFDAS